MDISALSLALGATPETVGQVTAEPGFDAVLEQVDLAGFIPPGAPPGPEPPPDLLVAGEEVEVVEPNAQPQKLDFHPLQKADADFAKPQLSSEVVDSEKVSVTSPSSGTAEEAMKWLVGQMSDSFFGSPEPAIGCPTPALDSKDSRLSSSKKEVYYFCPPDFYDKFKLIDTEPGFCGTETLSPNLGKEVPKLSSSAGSKKTRTDQATGPAIDQEIVDGLNVVSVERFQEEKYIEQKAKESIDGSKKGQINPSDECPAVPEPVGFPTTNPKPVGFPTTTGELSGFNNSKRGQLSTSSETKSDQKSAIASSTMELKKLHRNSDSEDKAIKLDGKFDSDTTVITEKPADEATPDGSKSRDKRATSKLEWVELTSAKRSGKTMEFEETKIEEKKKVDVSSALTSATNEIKKPSLKPEEADLVVKQVADKLQLLASARPRNGVTIHLNPDDLGSITVVIKSVGRMVDTQITASDSRVSEALDQNRSRLAEAMDSKGYQLQSVSVSQQSGHATQQDSSSKSWQQANQEQSQRQNQSGQQHGHRGHHDRHMDQPKANVRAWSRRNEGVDLAI